MKPPPLDKPTRRTVEALFRELVREKVNGYEDGEYRQLCEQVEALESKLLDNPKLKELIKKKDAAWKKKYEQGKEVVEKVNRVRRNYLAKGLTPAIRVQINQLVEWVNS